MTVSAAGLLRRAEEQGRPRAALRARLLLVCAHFAAGEQTTATRTLIPAIITCSERGLVRPVLDAGPGISVILDAVAASLQRGAWPEGWSPAAAAFLAAVRRDGR